jgi:hypothetical protein
MKGVINIYNTAITLPFQPSDEYIYGYDKPLKDKKWERQEMPYFFEKVDYDSNEDLILTNQQLVYAKEEVRRCKEGFWFFNNVRGVATPTFLTGKNYFYLQWWKLEDDIYADYREVDRRYFLHLDHWEKIQWCYGVMTGKKRREGLTSKATANLIYECIFFKDSKCGLVSKTRDDARAAFTDMVSFGYRQLPVFLKPKQLNREGSVTELVFAHKSQSNKDGASSGISDGEGNRSRVNFKAPAINVYDSGRTSRLLLDEFAKLPPEVPASKTFAVISKTLVKGVKRVGFVEMPSTVNDLTKGGGAEFKILWDSGNQFKKKPTTNRLVRYFSPAFEGFEGFIDEYGQSVLEEPTEEQYNYLVKKWVKRDEVTGELLSELTEDDIKKGAKYYVSVTRRIDLEGDLLEEEQRMNPCNETEMFQSALSDCVFNSANINKQIDYLADNQPYLRKVTFYRTLEQTVEVRDDINSFWSVLHFPKTGETNKSNVQERIKRPINIDKFVIGIDGYANSQGGRKYGSKAAAYIYDKEKMMFIAQYYGRPQTKDIFHEQMLLAAEYYGCKVWYEHTADDYKSYFVNRGKIGYLGKYPKSCLDPNKRDSVDLWYGFPINPFAMTKQLDNLIAYIETDKSTNETLCNRVYFIELLKQMLLFEPDDRTKSDCVVAAMIALCCGLEPSIKTILPTSPLVRVYK